MRTLSSPRVASTRSACCRRADADGCRDGPRRVQDRVLPSARGATPPPRGGPSRPPPGDPRARRRWRATACISDKTGGPIGRTRACGPTRTIRSTHPASIPRTEDSDETRLRASAMKASATATATPPPPRRVVRNSTPLVPRPDLPRALHPHPRERRWWPQTPVYLRRRRCTRMVRRRGASFVARQPERPCSRWTPVPRPAVVVRVASCSDARGSAAGPPRRRVHTSPRR